MAEKKNPAGRKRKSNKNVRENAEKQQLSARRKKNPQPNNGQKKDRSKKRRAEKDQKQNGVQNPQTGSQTPPTGNPARPTGGSTPQPAGGQNQQTGGQNQQNGGQNPPTGGGTGRSNSGSIFARSVTNTLKKGDDKFNQTVAMKDDSNSVLAIAAGSKQLAILKGANGKYTFSFDKSTLALLNFGPEFAQSNLATILENQLDVSDDESSISVFQKANEEFVFQVKAQNKKPIVIKVGAFDVSIEYEGKTYTALLDANAIGAKKEDATNNFTLSTKFFEELVDSNNTKIKNIQTIRIPPFLWGEYFSIMVTQQTAPQSNQNAVFTKKQIGNLELITCLLNGQPPYCFVKDVNKNVVYLYHDGGLRKVKSIKVFAKNANPFILVETTNKKSAPVRLEFPSAANRNPFIADLESNVLDITTPAVSDPNMLETSLNFKDKNGNPLPVEKKDSTDYDNYVFAVKSRNTTVKDKEKTEKTVKTEEPKKPEEEPKKPKEEKKEEKQEEKKDWELPGGSKKINVTFLAETLLPISAAFCLFGAALTGLGPFIVVGIIAMVASAVLMAIDGTEMHWSKRKIDMQLRDNKYSKFREHDNEYGKALEKSNENLMEAQAMVENSSGEDDFSRKFMDLYGQFGISPEGPNLAERYLFALNQIPTAEDYQAFAQIEYASTDQSRNDLIEAYLGTKIDADREKLRQAFYQPAFFDVAHNDEQNAASTQLERWCKQAEEVERLEKDNSATPKQIEEAKSQLTNIERDVFERIFPNNDSFETLVQERSIEDIQTIIQSYPSQISASDNDAVKEQKLNALIDKHLPSLKNKDKADVRTFIQDQIKADQSKAKGKKPSAKQQEKEEKEKQEKLQTFAKTKNEALQTAQRAKLFRDKEGKLSIKQVREFVSACTKASSSSYETREKRKEIEKYFKKNSNEAVQSLLTLETDKARQKDLIVRYGDFFAKKFLYQSDSQILLERLTDRLSPENRELAQAAFAYHAARIDKQLANMHGQIYQTESEKQSLKMVNTYAKLIEQAQLVAQGKLPKGLEALTGKMYDTMLFGDCEYIAGESDLPSHIYVAKILNSASNQYKDLHRRIKDSKILQEILAAYISPKKSNNIYMPKNSYTKYIKGVGTVENFGQLSGYNRSEEKITLLDIVEEHIKEAFIARYIELVNNKTTEKDHDKLAVQEQQVREKMEALSTGDIIKFLQDDFADAWENDRLTTYLNLYKEKEKFDKEIEERTSFRDQAKELKLKKLPKKVASFKDGKIVIHDTELAGLIEEYGTIFTDLSLDEQEAFIQLSYARMQYAAEIEKNKNLTPGQIESFESQIDQIDRFCEDKFDGTLARRFVSELARINLKELVSAENQAAADATLRDLAQKGDKTVFNTCSKDVQEKFSDQLDEHKQIISLIRSLPPQERARVIREIENNKGDIVKAVCAAASMTEVDGKTVLDHIVAKADLSAENLREGRARLTKKDLESIAKSLKNNEYATVQSTANRTYTVQEQTLGEELINQGVKRGVKQAQMTQEELDGQSENLAAEESIKNIEELQENFMEIVTKIQNNLGKTPNSFYDFSKDDIDNILSLDRATLHKYGVEEEDVRAVLEGLSSAELSSVTKILTKYRKKSKKLSRKKASDANARLKRDNKLKELWKSAKTQLEAAFEAKVKKKKAEFAAEKDESIKKTKLKKHKESKKIRKSARHYVRRKIFNKNKDKTAENVEENAAEAAAQNVVDNAVEQEA